MEDSTSFKRGVNWFMANLSMVTYARPVLVSTTKACGFLVSTLEASRTIVMVSTADGHKEHKQKEIVVGDVSVGLFI